MIREGWTGRVVRTAVTDARNEILTSYLRIPVLYTASDAFSKVCSDTTYFW